jgi:hypothetical protein
VNVVDAVARGALRLTLAGTHATDPCGSLYWEEETGPRHPAGNCTPRSASTCVCKRGCFQKQMNGGLYALRTATRTHTHTHTRQQPSRAPAPTPDASLTQAQPRSSCCLCFPACGVRTQPIHSTDELERECAGGVGGALSVHSARRHRPTTPASRPRARNRHRRLPLRKRVHAATTIQCSNSPFAGTTKHACSGRVPALAHHTYSARTRPALAHHGIQWPNSPLAATTIDIVADSPRAVHRVTACRGRRLSLSLLVASHDTARQ